MAGSPQGKSSKPPAKQTSVQICTHLRHPPIGISRVAHTASCIPLVGPRRSTEVVVPGAGLPTCRGRRTRDTLLYVYVHVCT